MFCIDIREPSAIGYSELCKILCFPYQSSICCSERIIELNSLGVDKLYSFGKTLLDRDIYVIGKGHSSIVVLAHHNVHGFIALKIRRMDSKRFSMEYEANVLKRVVSTGFAPKLYGYSQNFLAREYIDGCILASLISTYREYKNIIINALKNLLKAALTVDLAGVDIVEISNPLKHVVYLCCNLGKPFFIDFESAKITPRSLNFTKIVSFIIRCSRLSIAREVLNIDRYKLEKIISLSREYKTTIDMNRRISIAEEIMNLLD